MANKILKCKDCDDDFVFSEDEQEFFREKNFTEPKRCPACRKAKRESKRKEGSKN